MKFARAILSILLCASGAVLFAQAPKEAKPSLTHAEQVALQAILQKESELTTQFRDQEQLKNQIIGDINQAHPGWVFDTNNGFIAKQVPAKPEPKPEAPKPDAKK